MPTGLGVDPQDYLRPPNFVFQAGWIRVRDMNRIHANIESARKCCGFKNRKERTCLDWIVAITRLTFNIMFMLHFGECCKILKISSMTTMKQQFAKNSPGFWKMIFGEPVASPTPHWHRHCWGPQTASGRRSGMPGGQVRHMITWVAWKQDQLNHGLHGLHNWFFCANFLLKHLFLCAYFFFGLLKSDPSWKKRKTPCFLCPQSYWHLATQVRMLSCICAIRIPAIWRPEIHGVFHKVERATWGQWAPQMGYSLRWVIASLRNPYFDNPCNSWVLILQIFAIAHC